MWNVSRGDASYSETSTRSVFMMAMVFLLSAMIGAALTPLVLNATDSSKATTVECDELIVQVALAG